MIRALVLLIAIYLLAVGPTLTWLEFSSGSENLNVATALEVRRDGRWLIPTLEGEARIAKPPLTAWLTAGAIPPSTARDLSSPRFDVRESARWRLAWQARWPFLLSSALMLVGVFELGRVLGAGDGRIGLVAAAVCATNLLFLRFGRAATTDVQLALWVTWTNVALAHAIFTGRRRGGAAVAGAMLALAFMSKGPVALAQTLAPAAVFIAWDAGKGGRDDAAVPRRPLLGPVLLGLAVFALVALPWYALVALKTPGVWERWWMEITRKGATDLPASRWYSYAALVPLMMPWTVFLIAGAAVIARDLKVDPRSERSSGMMFALLLVLVPILIMSLVRDREQRYLLPLAGPGAMIAARAVVEHFETRHRRDPADRIVVAIHWLLVAVIAVGFPLVAALALRRADASRPWLSLAAALLLANLGLFVVVAGVAFHRRQSGAIVVASVAVMLLAHAVFLAGYRHTREGLSEMKPLADAIWRERPDAVMLTTGPRRKRAPADLAIYLNRPVPWTDATPDPSQNHGDVVLVVRQDRRDAAPPRPPPGWTTLHKVRRDDNWWHAFVPAAPAGAPTPLQAE